MSKNMKKKPHSAEFKFKVAIEAIRGEKTMAELCQEFGVVSSQIFKWKRMVLDAGACVFGQSNSTGTDQRDIEKLHATIGRLKVENDFLEHVLRRSR
jgi:transposase